jgi:ClpP class serine protease
MTLGTPELADAVAAAGKRVPIVAYTSGLMASAAYWVGSQASAIVASRSARVGSIGVYAAITDLSGLYASMGVKVEVFKNSEASLKAMGVPGTSLSDDQRAHLRSDVQATFDEFKATVSAARPRVSIDSMRGQTLSGQAAVKAGLVDHIGSLADAIAIARRARR